MFEVNKYQFFSFCNESKLSTEGTKWGLRERSWFNSNIINLTAKSMD